MDIQQIISHHFGNNDREDHYCHFEDIWRPKREFKYLLFKHDTSGRNTKILMFSFEKMTQKGLVLTPSAVCAPCLKKGRTLAKKYDTQQQKGNGRRKLKIFTLFNF